MSETPKSHQPSLAGRFFRWLFRRQTQGRALIGLAALVTLVAVFYLEEDWRGWHAWQNCRRELEAKGIKVDQKAEIPPPVPDDQNVFAVPEMRQWLLGKGASDLRARMEDIYGFGDTNRPSIRMVVAEVALSLAGSNSPPPDFTVLSYGDPEAKAEVSKLIKNAVGPYFIDPFGFILMLRRPEEVQPAKILLRCQTAPSAKELEQFLTNGFLSEKVVKIDDHEENVLTEPVSNSSYKVTMEAPGTAADLLARIAVLEPQFAVMRQAFQRPYVRILGGDQKPDPDLFPTISLIAPLARMLSAQAQCHLLLGQPEEALRDLTLSQDLCRIVEDLPRSAWGMVATLLRETVTAIDLGVIADGLQRHAWNDAQLAALQNQLKNINFVSDWKQIMLAEPARISDFLPNATAFDLGELCFGGFLWPSNAWTTLKATVVGELIPRGWVYQNMVQLANGRQALAESSDSAGQLVFPKKVDAVAIMAKSHPSPYNYLARTADPRDSKHCRNSARIETQVHEALIACALERYRLAPQRISQNARRTCAAVHRKISARHHRRPAADLSSDSKRKIPALFRRLERDGRRRKGIAVIPKRRG